MNQNIFNVKIELAYPVGFQLHLITWENDADNYSTQIISGLTKSDVHFYLDFVKNFSSLNSPSSPGLGNEYYSIEEIKDLFFETLEQHPNVSEDLKKEFYKIKENDYNFSEFILENILGYTVDYDDHEEGQMFCRVFESYKVFEIREPIVDVSKEFKQ